jgi:hypothetical protein
MYFVVYYMTHNITYYELYKLDAISNFSQYICSTLLQSNCSSTMYSVLRCKCHLCYAPIFLCSYCKQWLFSYFCSKSHERFNLINDYYVNIISMFCSCVKVFDWLDWTMWSMGPSILSFIGLCIMGDQIQKPSWHPHENHN